MKYIALDLDGTLLNSQNELSENTLNYLNNIQKDGKKIILCSGRSFAGIKHLADKLNIKEHGGYIIGYNGGLVSCPRRDKDLYTNNFTKNEVEELFKIIGNHADNFVTYGPGKINCINPNDRIKRSSEIMQAEITTDFLVESPKVVLQDEIHIIDEIYEDVKQVVKRKYPNYNVFRSVPQLIEITPPNSDKASGLKKLIELEQLDENSLIAFGDGENDISMLEYATIGVAMENAMQCAKDVSDRVTLSNDNDGIAYMLEQIFRGEQ